MNSTPVVTLLCGMAVVAVSSAQAPRFDDVVRNLRNPDPKVRQSAVRLLREANYPEAIVPMAPLVNDPVDAVQLEAIAAELSFFLVEDIPERRRVGLVVEVRNRGAAMTAFERGRLAVWPRPAPPELVSELLRAVDDDHPRVRLEAIYAVGTIAAPPLGSDAEAQLLTTLDHYDPAIRAGAARVAGRLGVRAASDALITGINDSSAAVRYAAMRALGDLREERAVVALAEQLTFYERGEGAWTALDGLARIAHGSSIPLFAARVSDRDPQMRRAAAEGLGRTGAAETRSTLETGATSDQSPIVRAAMTFALQKLGGHYVPRLVEFLADSRTAPQVQDYLLELGPGIEGALLPSLQEPDGAIRAAVADVLGAIGGTASLTALDAMTDRDRGAVEAARRAAERIRMRQAR